MKIAVALLSAFVSAPAAYPIPPQPLRWLWRDAKLVVVAKAGPSIRLEPRDDGFSARVTLQVERVLKGTLDGQAAVTVHYAANLVCPEPDRYPEGATVLAFLAWNDRSQVWHAPGLSYGAKILKPAVLDRYVARLEELAAIDRAPKDEAGARLAEWLVASMEHPDTRWEGAYDVACRKAPAHDPFTEEQRRRLLVALAEAPAVGDPELLIAEGALAGEPDRRVDEALVRALRAGVASGDYGGRRAMALLTSRRSLDFGPALLRAYDEAESAAARSEALRRFLDRFPH